MVNVFNLMPGDRVMIVTKWPPAGKQDPRGGMDHWLGKIMTVRSICDDCVKMEEDRGEFMGDGWYWFAELLDGIVLPDSELQFDPADDEGIKTLFGI